MTTGATGTLDEAYQRLHVTGPEFDGWLSNHGPMAAEVMVRRGYAGNVQRWLDAYMRRLEEFPRAAPPRSARTGRRRWATSAASPTGLPTSGAS